MRYPRCEQIPGKIMSHRMYLGSHTFEVSTIKETILQDRYIAEMNKLLALLSFTRVTPNDVILKKDGSVDPAVVKAVKALSKKAIVLTIKQLARIDMVAGTKPYLI